MLTQHSKRSQTRVYVRVLQLLPHHLVLYPSPTRSVQRVLCHDLQGAVPGCPVGWGSATVSPRCSLLQHTPWAALTAALPPATLAPGSS